MKRNGDTCSREAHRLLRRSHRLNLHFRQRRASPGQISRGSLGIFGVVIRDGRLDRIFSQHGAVHYFIQTSAITPRDRQRLFLPATRRGRTLHGRQTQLLRDLGVPDLSGVLERHAAHEFGQVARARDGAAAAEGLELDVADRLAAGVDADLQLHHVAARRRPDQARADVRVRFRHRPHVARSAVVVEQWETP